MLNHTNPPAPRYLQGNLSFQAGGRAAEKACWSRVDSHKLHSNLFWVLDLVDGSATFCFQATAALSGSTEADRDL